MNPMDLTGRRYLVTGASSGIGRETAILLSELGAEVTVSGRNLDRLQQTLGELSGAGHQVAAFDLAALDEIPGWMKGLAVDRPFDGLVHSAGLHAMTPARSISAAKIDALMRTNFSAAAMLARGFSQKSCRRDTGGSIVFLSSVVAQAGQPAVSLYSATKAALTGLAKSLAVELARDLIRVNCVAPGIVKSEMSDQMRESLAPEQFDAIERMHPLGLGSGRDVAHAIAFLLAATGRWITGTTLIVDGGYLAQ
ncbi:MAG: SDR family NAD(P)-dependent oxidoreductase [Bryobacteraceae bacterium]